MTFSTLCCERAHTLFVSVRPFKDEKKALAKYPRCRGPVTLNQRFTDQREEWRYREALARSASWSTRVRLWIAEKRVVEWPPHRSSQKQEGLGIIDWMSNTADSGPERLTTAAPWAWRNGYSLRGRGFLRRRSRPWI